MYLTKVEIAEYYFLLQTYVVKKPHKQMYCRKITLLSMYINMKVRMWHQMKIAFQKSDETNNMDRLK